MFDMSTEIPRCDFAGCIRAAHSKGLCQAHYQQKRTGRELTPIRVKGTGPECGFPDCERPARSKKLCAGHYAQMLRGDRLKPLLSRASGAPYGPKTAGLPLIERIDKATRRSSVTGCLLWERSKSSAGAGVLSIDGKSTVVSAPAFELWFGIDVGSKHILRACGNAACIEPGHMYVPGVTPDWERFDSPLFMVSDGTLPADSERTLIYRLGDVIVRTVGGLTDEEADAGIRLFMGTIDEQEPSKVERGVWLKQLAFLRRGGEIKTLVSPLR